MDDNTPVEDSTPITDPAPPIADAPAPVDTSAPEPTPVSSSSTFNPRSSDELSFLRNILSPKAWAARRAVTTARLAKVMELAHAKGTIDRTAVRLHLEVSQAAATRYLTALVKQGKLVRRHTQGDTLYTVK